MNRKWINEKDFVIDIPEALDDERFVLYIIVLYIDYRYISLAVCEFADVIDNSSDNSPYD